MRRPLFDAVRETIMPQSDADFHAVLMSAA